MSLKATRKNYFFAPIESVISEKRNQSDSYSKSQDSTFRKSPNNSIEIARRQHLKKREKKFERDKKVSQGVKLRSQSISHSFCPNLNPSPIKRRQQKPVTSFSRQNPIQNVKLKEDIVQSQISTEVPNSLTNNFLLEDQAGFVRFSEPIASSSSANHKKKMQAKKRGSSSILKNAKRAFSCNKIDMNYLKFRNRNLSQALSVNTTKTKATRLLQRLRQHYLKNGGKRLYSYWDLGEQDKFKDEIFPPKLSSIFHGKSELFSKCEQMVDRGEISWRRIPELFHPSSNLILRKQNSQQKIIVNEKSLTSTELALALNSIQKIDKFFQKFFEGDCTYEKHGLYCVKIFQSNCWKSVIIDDLIPVIVERDPITKKEILQPLFVDVERPSSEKGQQIEIWPFLLQKAYASFYDGYESISCKNNIIDWLEEILMTCSQKYSFPDDEDITDESVSRLNRILGFPEAGSYSQRHQSIVISCNIKTKEPVIIERRGSPGGSSIQEASSDLIIRTLRGQRKMKVRHALEIFHTYYLFVPFGLEFYNSCQVPVGNRGGIKSKSKGEDEFVRLKYRKQVCMSSFQVQESGPFLISVRQKDRKFYQRLNNRHEYIWNRVVLAQRQFRDEYRWVDGSYSRKKSISFNHYLEKGRYYLMCLPETATTDQQENIISTNSSQLTVLVLSKTQIGLQKQLYEESKGIFQKTCGDLAQRFGCFKQINPQMCSYSYISREVGLIIENIANEKQVGKVALMRSIQGLKAKVEIAPWNLDFCINEYEAEPNKRKYKKNMEVLITGGQEYTVVLMTKGGIDQKFFKVFKFT